MHNHCKELDPPQQMVNVPQKLYVHSGLPRKTYRTTLTLKVTSFVKHVNINIGRLLSTLSKHSSPKTCLIRRVTRRPKKPLGLYSGWVCDLPLHVVLIGYMSNAPCHSHECSKGHARNNLHPRLVKETLQDAAFEKYEKGVRLFYINKINQ